MTRRKKAPADQGENGQPSAVVRAADPLAVEQAVLDLKEATERMALLGTAILKRDALRLELRSTRQKARELQAALNRAELEVASYCRGVVRWEDR